MSAGLEVHVKGAQRHLKKESKKRNDKVSKGIKRLLGRAEGYMKNNVPVLAGILKSSIHSEMTGVQDGQIYASVAYAHHADEHARKPTRKNFIHKTRIFIMREISGILK